MTRSRILILSSIFILLALFLALDGGRYLRLDFLQAQQTALEAYRVAHPWLSAGAYFAVYVLLTALSVPGAAVLSVLGGAIFGLLWGTLIVSFASTLGATLAFLVARYLLRDWVEQRFAPRLQQVNAGVARDGAYYLFTLRLVPIVPFFIINLALGLTRLRTWTFAWVSQLGMLGATVVYVNAGTQLAKVDSVRGILSLDLLAAFALLGLFPWLARKLTSGIRARRRLAQWPRPRRFDRNLVVIGAGSAGLVTAYIAAAVKARVTLIEKHKMGGDCLNTGCVPSKALISTAKALARIRRAGTLGIHTAHAEFDFAEVMARVHRVVHAIEPHDSIERYTKLGVEVVEGTARMRSPWEVAVACKDGSSKIYTTRSIVIAAGARPFVPPIPGIESTGYLTSDNLWQLRELPQRLVVLGGGPIGTELTQAFARLGSQVTQVEMLPRILAREDPEVSALITERLRAEGVTVLAGHQAERFVREGDEKVLIARHEGADVRIAFDGLLVAVGRIANLEGYGLEELGIPCSRTIETNDYLQTLYPNIYAAGDVAGPYQFTHTAAHQAWYAAVNALLHPFKKFRVDYSVIPWATFTDPEVARVGLNETEAIEQGASYEITRYSLDELDRAITDDATEGFVKVLTVPGQDRILGVTIVGEHAGDLLAEFVLAMRQGIGLNKILATIHIYPTFAEANKYAAGAWKRAHAPQRLLDWVERFHAWRRNADASTP